MSGVSLPSVSSARFGLIGNPENRRVREFQAAVEACGYQAPECVSYEALLRNESVLALGDFDLIRIDSPGENETVAKGLIQLCGIGPGYSIKLFTQSHLFCRAFQS